MNWHNSYYHTFYISCILLVGILVGPSQLSGQCDTDQNYWEKSWVSCEKTTNPNPDRPFSHWVMYEFNTPQSLNESFIWNANRPGELEFGVREIEVDYSLDGVTWVNLGAYTFPQAPGTDDYQGVEGPDFQGLFVRKILITVMSTYGNGDCASFAEIRFNINPDACYGVVDACGICDGEGIPAWYADADADGLGDPNDVVEACDPPTGYVANADDNCDNGLLGWQEVGAIFEENGCLGCHGALSLGGLNLESYDRAIQGGNKCGSNIITGDILVSIITIDAYDGCSVPILFPAMNERVGGNMDESELALLQQWIDAGAPEDCNCLDNAPDTDQDGVCDAIDQCPGFDNQLIGTPCDDGLVCTENDVWRADCSCMGDPKTDSDLDGVCDDEDAAPFDPCTADGIIDGTEPADWQAQPSNDCDNDGVTVGDVDLDDYNSCQDDKGLLSTVACTCGDNALVNGPSLVYSRGINNADRGGGLPDGSFTNFIAGNDSLVLRFPYMSVGETICFTALYDETDSQVAITLNGNLYTIVQDPTNNLSDPQEICIQTLDEGIQTAVIQSGNSRITIDGGRYEYCPCNDPGNENEQQFLCQAYSSRFGLQTLADCRIALCAGDSLQLMASTSNLVFDWLSPQGEAFQSSTLDLGVITEMDEGLYTAQYRGENGCVETKEIFVQITESPFTEVTPINPNCSELTSGALRFDFDDHPFRTNIEFSITGEEGPYEGTEDGNEQYTISGLPIGTYHTWARWGDDSCPIFLGDIALVEESAPEIDAGDRVLVCEGETVTLTANGPGNLTYTWSNGAQGASQTFEAALEDFVNKSVVYYVTATDEKSCTSMDSVEVRILSQPRVTTTFTEASCDQPSGAISFAFSDHPNRTGIEFSINGPAGTYQETTDNSTTYTIGELPSGSYEVWARWGNTECPIDLGRIDIPSSFDAAPNIDAGMDQVICEGDTATFTVDGPADLLYVWSTGDTSKTIKVSPTIMLDNTFKRAFDYSVTTVDANGCSATDEVTLTVLNERNEVTIDHTPWICDSALGKITVSFMDHPDFDIIELNITGENGNFIPVQDQMGAYTFENLEVGQYEVWARRPDGICAKRYGIISIGDGNTENNQQTMAICEAKIGNKEWQPLDDCSISICAGDPLSLRLSNVGGDVNWSGPNGASNLGVLSFSNISIAQAGTYTAEFQNINGCIDRKTMTITVDPFPEQVWACEAQIDDNPWAVLSNCMVDMTEGQRLSLRVQGSTDTLTWTLPDGQSFDRVALSNASIKLSDSGTYTASIVNETGCIKATEFLIRVSPKPTLDIVCEASSNNGAWEILEDCTITICEGDRLALRIPNQGTNWQWSGPNNFVGDTSMANFNPVATTDAGEYQVSFTDINGDLQQKAFTINVDPAPNITFAPQWSSTNSNWQDIANDTLNLCAGSSLVIRMSTGGESYDWIGPNGYEENTSQLTFAMTEVAQSGLYTAIYTDDKGCQRSKSVVLNVLPSPEVTFNCQVAYEAGLWEAVPNCKIEVCEGQSLKLRFTNTNTSLMWLLPDGTTFVGPELAIDNASNSYAGMYSATFTNSSGCSVTTSLEVAVNNSAAANATCQVLTTQDSWEEIGDCSLSVCAGDDVMIRIGNIDGMVSWSGPNGLLQMGILELDGVGANNGGNYLATFQNEFGCIVNREIELSVDTLPLQVWVCEAQIEDQVWLNLQNCVLDVEEGQTFRLRMNGAEGMVNWTLPDGTTQNVGTMEIMSTTMNQAGAYSAMVQNEAGCKRTQMITVRVSPPPGADQNCEASINGEPWQVLPDCQVEVCEGETLDLRVSGQGSIWDWKGPADSTTNNAILSLDQITVSQSGTYTLSFEDSTGRMATKSFEVIVNQATTMTFQAQQRINDNWIDLEDGIVDICEGATVALRLSDQNVRFDWSGPNGYQSTGAELSIANISGAQSGIYMATYTGNMGCQMEELVEIKVKTFSPAEIACQASINGGRWATAQDCQVLACLGSTLELRFGDTQIPVQWTRPDGLTLDTNILVIDQLNMAKTGTYKASMVTSNGCTVTKEMEVLLDQESVNSTICQASTEPGFWFDLQVCAVKACAGQPLTLGVNDGNVPVHWILPDGSESDSTRLNLGIIESNQAGQYVAEVTTNDGCMVRKAITVDIVPQPQVSATIEEPSQMDSLGAIHLDFGGESGNGIIEFSIDNGITYAYKVPINEGEVTISDLEMADYTVYARWEGSSCSTWVGDFTIDDCSMVTSFNERSPNQYRLNSSNESVIIASMLSGEEHCGNLGFELTRLADGEGYVEFHVYFDQPQNWSGFESIQVHQCQQSIPFTLQMMDESAGMSIMEGIPNGLSIGFNLSSNTASKDSIMELTIRVDATNLGVGETTTFTFNTIEVCLNGAVSTSNNQEALVPAHLTITPNPSSVDRETTYSLYMPNEERAHIQIWTMSGQLVRQQTVQLLNGRVSDVLAVDIPAGVYNLRATGDRTVLVKSFVLTE